MRVLVTGGTGFIGANVVRHLLARGDRVRALVRSTSPSLCLEGLELERVRGDLGDVEGLARLMDGVEGVYHVAGTFDPGPRGESTMHRVHVVGTRNLLSAAAAAGVGRVVVCSSSVTVGFGPRHAPGDEQTPVPVDRVYGRSGPLRAYHDTKRQAEELAAGWTRGGVEAVVVCPDFTVGAWDLKPTSGTLVLAMARGWVPVYFRGGKCFADADDVAAAHLAAMDRGRPGERYLLGTHNLSYREFMEAVGRVVGRRPPLLPVPRTLTRAAGLLGALGARIDAHRFAPLEPHVLATTHQERYRSGRKAEAELGMGRTPVEQSIDKAWRWFRDHGYLG